MHMLSQHGTRTLCARYVSPLGYTSVRTSRGPQVRSIRFTTEREQVTCRECKQILHEYELAYGPYTGGA